MRRYRGRRRRYARKQPGRFTRFVRGAQTAMGVASTALSIAKGVASLVNVEYKVFAHSATTAVTSAGTIIPLSLIAQGDDRSQRNGRSIKLKSVYLKGYGSHDALGLESQIIRVILFMDMQQQGVVPTVTMFLKTANVIDHKNYDNRDRWLTLFDKNIVVDGNHQSITLTKFFKKMNHKIEYIGTDATQASQGSGNLYLLLVTNEPSVNYPDFIHNFEMRYLDN